MSMFEFVVKSNENGEKRKIKGGKGEGEQVTLSRSPQCHARAGKREEGEEEDDRGV